MNLVETNAYLAWVNQSDGRIKNTDPNLQIWASALAGATSAEVREVTLHHYKYNDTAITPSGIRKACAALRERTAAQQSALTAAPTIRHPNTFRARNPELWDQLIQQGAANRRTQLQTKGLIT